MQFIIEENTSTRKGDGDCGCKNNRTEQAQGVLTPRDIFDMIPKLTITGIDFRRDGVRHEEMFKF